MIWLLDIFGWKLKTPLHHFTSIMSTYLSPSNHDATVSSSSLTTTATDHIFVLKSSAHRPCQGLILICPQGEFLKSIMWVTQVNHNDFLGASHHVLLCFSSVSLSNIQGIFWMVGSGSTWIFHVIFVAGSTIQTLLWRCQADRTASSLTLCPQKPERPLRSCRIGLPSCTPMASIRWA